MLDDKKEQMVLDMMKTYGNSLINEPEVIRAYKQNCGRLYKKIKKSESPEEVMIHAADLTSILVLGFVYTDNEVPEHQDTLTRLRRMDPLITECIINKLHFSMIDYREKYMDMLIIDEIDTPQNRQKTFQALIEAQDLDIEDDETMNSEEKDEIARGLPIINVVKVDIAMKGLEELRKNMSDHFSRPSFLKLTRLEDMESQLDTKVQSLFQSDVFLETIRLN